MSGKSRERDARYARLATGMVAYALGISEEEMITQARGSADVAYGRQIAMYAVYVGFGISLARVAIAFDRDRSTVSHACHLIEDKREDRLFDEWLDALEATLRQAAGLSGEAQAA